MRIAFTGDVACFDNISIKISEEVIDFLRNSDYLCCNLEAPIVSCKYKKIHKQGPSLAQKEAVVDFLEHCGTTHITVANNHIMDYGFEGLANTLEKLKKYPVCGAAQEIGYVYSPLILEKNDLKVGILAVAENAFGSAYAGHGGIAVYDSPECFEAFEKLRAQVDFLIISFHAGAEELDFPLPEWQEIYKQYCDRGADVIIGHHPHVSQGYEKYKNSMIFYSLGNFYFDYPQKCGEGFSVILDLQRGHDIRFELLPHQYGNGMIIPAENRFEFLNKRLAEASEYIDDQAVNMMNNIYMVYFRAMNQYQDSNNIFKDIVKRILRFFSEKNTSMTMNEMLWLFHNVCIDTHRFIIRRALKNLYEKMKK